MLEYHIEFFVLSDWRLLERCYRSFRSSGTHSVAGLVAGNLSMERSAFNRQGIEEE